jgi:hypothetical protein
VRGKNWHAESATGTKRILLVLSGIQNRTFVPWQPCTGFSFQ